MCNFVAKEYKNTQINEMGQLSDLKQGRVYLKPNKYLTTVWGRVTWDTT